MSFTNLHNHSDASIADGLFSPKKWCEALKEKGFKAHALTDHGVMTNLLPFYKAAKDVGIIPIMGVEAYFVDDPLDKTPTNRKSSHLVLLAKNHEGYRNLCKLSYLSFTDGFYYRNRIGLEWLKAHKEGLVCLSACQGGVLANEVWRKKKGEPGIGLKERYAQFREIFADDFYVEFQPHSTINTEEDGTTFDSQAMINEALFELRNEIGFKPIVTNDCHYILREHAIIQKTLKEMQWRRASDTSAESKTVTKDYSCDSLWLKKENELIDSFSAKHGYLPKKLLMDGVENTEEVLEKCSRFEFPKSRYLPTFVPPTKKPVSSKKFFLALAKKLLLEFLADGDLHASKKEYVERFKKEYAVISKYDLEDYFLIVWDLIRFARSKGIYSGLGRGSAAGCLISYLMGIVKIDPLEHNLIFERFLNENRCETGELPDIDLDFESDRRTEIKQYIFDKYGATHVCEIGTYGRMKLKTSIIDFGKAFEVGTDKELHAITTKLDLDKEDAQSLIAACEADEELMRLCEENPEFAFTVDEINGQIKSQGVHPAGLLICSENISELLPLKTAKSAKSGERVLTTQPEDKHVIAQGFMKMDILGLKEYDVIKYVLENAPGCTLTPKNYVEEIMAMERATPDEKVWKMFQEGKSDAVFQFSSSGMKELLQMIVPTHVNDLIAANALYRPGCLENGWHIQYCKRKHGEEEVVYAHEDVEVSLKDTYGVIVFQEQFMDVMHRLGGIPLVEADIIRSALGKKDKVKLGKFKAKFVDGASKKIKKKQAEALWDQIEKASGYSFNKSHSAVYSVLAYISQYLKVNFPTYFWAAQIDWDIRKNKLEEMLVNKRAAKEMGVEFIPPHINKSKIKITADVSGVVWSLTSIKGLGEKAAVEIVAQQPYADFDDFYGKVNKTKVKYNNIQALITAGALDDFGDRRELLNILCEMHNKRSKGAKKRKVSWSDEDLMMAFYKSMGFFEKKIKTVRSFDSCVMTEQDIREMGEGDLIAVGGMISNVKVITTKKGDKMAFVTLTDLDEEIEVTAFSKSYERFKDILKEGKVVQLHGVKSCYKEKQNLLELQRVEEK